MYGCSGVPTSSGNSNRTQLFRISYRRMSPQTPPCVLHRRLSHHERRLVPLQLLFSDGYRFGIYLQISAKHAPHNRLQKAQPFYGHRLQVTLSYFYPL
jgi:hypothetical protein